MITPQKRLKMEKLVYDVFSALDPTGANTKRYKDMFSSMSDSQFDKFFQDLFKDPDSYLILTTADYGMDLRLENIEKASKILKVPLFEKIACPHYTMNKDQVVVSKEAVPVGYCHIKRTQQILAKKNGLSTTVDSRSSITGQVTGADKNGRESDLENAMLISIGLMETVKELNGPRADDLYMKQQMLSAISNKGFVSMEDMDSDPINKTTLNTVDVYLLGMGLNSDLVTKGLMTKKSVKEET